MQLCPLQVRLLDRMRHRLIVEIVIEVFARDLRESRITDDHPILLPHGASLQSFF